MSDSRDAVERFELLVEGQKLVVYQNARRQAHALLFVHGACASSRSWAEQQRKLCRSQHVLIPDLPGHGASEGSGGAHQVDRLRAALDALLAQLELEVIVVGHALGAALALELALSSPQRVKGLVLLCAPYRFAISPVLMQTLAAGTKALQTLLRELLFCAQTPKHQADKIFAQIQLPEAQVCRADLHACSAWSAGRRFRRLQIPSLLIAGRHDALLPWPQCEAMTLELPQCQFEIIEDAGHLPMLEQAQRVNELIASFAAGLANAR